MWLKENPMVRQGPVLALMLFTTVLGLAITWIALAG
jgi:hypothetical protein